MRLGLSAVPAVHAGRPARPRIDVLDALRGLALLGILQVNIQSFTWGAGEPLGYLAAPGSPDAHRTADQVVYFLQAAFLEGKFYPIFAFVFGVGLQLQMRSLRQTLQTLAQAAPSRTAAGARALYRRRLGVLFGMGILHSLLLYCGDVLAAYALCAAGLLCLEPVRTRALRRWALASMTLAACALFVPVLVVLALGIDESGSPVPEAVVAAHATYTGSGFLAQLTQRGTDAAWQQLGSIPLFWPQVVALMTLGMLAARQGWLLHPERHRLLWRRALQAGLGLGLPCALAGAALALLRMRDAPGAQGQWDAVLLGFGSLLSAAYVAGLLQARRHAPGRALAAWLGWAGRASLSNYLLQSLLMALLLGGWGLGWGAQATRLQLAGLGLLIFVAQVLASRAWLQRFDQGPLEALWRRWTYRGLTHPALPPAGQEGYPGPDARA